MKSSKLKNKTFISFLSIPNKPQDSRRYLIVLLLITLVFTFTLSGCDALSFITGNSAKTDVTGEEEEPVEQESKNGNNSSNGNNTDNEADAESLETRESTESSEKQDSDDADFIDPSEQTINVYYTDDTAQWLVGEARTVEGSGKLVEAVYEMMKDPTDASLIGLVPDTVKINSIKVMEKVAKVDFSSNLIDDRFISDTVDILLVYSIVNTLTEFSEVEAVEFYIDGKKLDILGQLDITDPIYRREDLIKE